MHLRIMSDLHLEFEGIARLATLETDKDGILVLPGDISPYVLKETLLGFLRMVAVQFKHVLCVLGNHEFYGGGSLETLNYETPVRALLYAHRTPLMPRGFQVHPPSHTK